MEAAGLFSPFKIRPNSGIQNSSHETFLHLKNTFFMNVVLLCFRHQRLARMLTEAYDLSRNVKIEPQQN